MGFVSAVMLMSLTMSLYLNNHLASVGLLFHPMRVEQDNLLIRRGEKCDCDKGYDCIDDECKLRCGGDILTAVDCPEDYRCIGEDVLWNIPGHCEKNNCGGLENKQCPGGYWCNRFGDSQDLMGVCVNEVCPAGCATWFDGCSICSCNVNGGAASCTYKFCEVMNPPYCVQEYKPAPELEEMIAKNEEMQFGTLHTLVSMFNRLDLKYKRIFLEAIKGKTVQKI